MIEESYNPLDKKHLAESTANALLGRPISPLPPATAFIGAGIYAIYFVGNFPAYAPIAERNRRERFEAPIYVGSAVPPGARKGGYGLGESPGKVLYSRLRQHANSIRQVENLNLEDFSCRYLVTEDIWIPLAEALLIERFKPIWNHLIDGFGIHDPGARRPQERSKWDMVHPGRSFATRLPPNRRKSDQILATLVAELRRRR